MPIVGALPLYQIVEKQNYNGQPGPINVFWYVSQTGSEPSALAVSTAFQTKMSAARRACSNTSWSSAFMQVWNVNSLTNFGEFTSYGAGTLSDGTQEAPRFMAASIRLLRTSKETRSGWKRLMGLTEGVLSTGTFTAGYLALLNTYAALLDDLLTAGGETLSPCIVGKSYDPDTGEENPPAVWLYNVIAGAAAVDRPTTQNSRKPF